MFSKSYQVLKPLFAKNGHCIYLSLNGRHTCSRLSETNASRKPPIIQKNETGHTKRIFDGHVGNCDDEYHPFFWIYLHQREKSLGKAVGDYLG